MRPIDWVEDSSAPGGGYVRLLDQTRLPQTEHWLRISSVADLVAAIRRLSTRGAPALGVAGALGVALAVRTLPPAAVPAALEALRTARPTAVNLARGVATAAAALPDPDAVLRAALAVRDGEITASVAMARRGADLLGELIGDPREPRDGGMTLATICNTGALAAVEHGTALAVVEQVLRDGHLARVIACETRPLLQGSRLTAWELQRMDAPFDLVVDSAMAHLMATGQVDAVLVGADRIAADGSVANKVGTFALALAARYAAPAPLPFLVVAPESTLDVDTPDGASIVVEDRGAEEVLSVRGVRIAPDGAGAVNPAFDVTPPELVTAIVTDIRVIRPGRDPLARTGVA